MGIPTIFENSMLNTCIYLHMSCPRLYLKGSQFTEAQPQPDFFEGLTIFLQCKAQALGEPNTLSSSLHLIRPSDNKSAVNF